jgi:hypothetical protein
MSWSDGTSRLDVTLHGSITFTDDLSDVASLSDGGWLKIRDRSALVPHTVEVHGSRGRLSHEYYVAGLSRPWGPEAQQFLASKIVLLVRQFGIGAEERVKTILERKGVNGVMEEIGLLTGDYARRLYFVALLDAAKLDARSVVPILQQVSERMRSDYDRRQVLERAAIRVTLEEPATSAYVEAVGRMKSSYDKRVVLTHLVEHTTLSADAKRSVLEAIPGIHSDYDRRQVLTAYLSRYGVETGLREPFGAAVRSIQSNYDRRQVLTEVARKGSVPSDVQRVAFDLVSSMSSDYDRAEVLLAFLNAGAIDAGSRQAFVSAAERIRSSHDQNRVLAALVRTERR